MKKAIEIVKSLIDEHYKEAWHTDYDTASTDNEFYDVGRYETLLLVLREFENVIDK